MSKSLNVVVAESVIVICRKLTYLVSIYIVFP